MKKKSEKNKHSDNRIWKILSWIIGPFSLLWILLRSGRKPHRLNYPCQRAALPFATIFLLQLISLLGFLSFLKSKKFWEKAGTSLGIIFVFLLFNIPYRSIYTPEWDPTDPNSPIGEPKGIHPGRVVWVHDTSATSWDEINGQWWDENNLSQSAVNAMMDTAILALTGKPTISEAWDTLFKFFNNGTGYTAGEIIGIKVNFNNADGYGDQDNETDANHQIVIALLRQLIHHAGVPETCIFIYDVLKRIPDRFYYPIIDSFPGVWFVDRYGGYTNDRRFVRGMSDTLIHFTGGGIQNEIVHIGDTNIVKAKYLIDIAILKIHAISGITIFGKNHYGSLYESPASPNLTEGLHDSIRPQVIQMGAWSPFVDLMAHRHLGKKTILFIGDGLYGGKQLGDNLPFKWSVFGDDWPSSVFMSQDPVAISSVMWDFLNAETNQMETSQNFLHEMAEPDSSYGTSSLGVHEHWDSWTNKHYVGPDSNGIDFIKIDMSGVKIKEKNYEKYYKKIRFLPPDRISIYSDYEEDILISLFDITGRNIFKTKKEGLKKGKNVIILEKLKNLKKGTYFIHIKFLKTKRKINYKIER